MQFTLKKTLIYSSIIIVLALLIYPKLKTDDKKDAPNGKADPNKPSPPIKVDVLKIENSILEYSIKAIGTLLASEEVELKPEVAGKIVLINFKEGSRVTKGQLLMKVNDAELQAELKKANLKLKLALDDKSRQDALYEKGGISLVEKETSNNNYEILVSEIEFLKARIQKTEIKAPFSGKIGLGEITNGAYIAPSDAIATIHNIDKIKIDFNIPERYATQIKVGAKINFKVQGQSEIFQGTVYAISPNIKESTRTIQIKAIANNIDSKLYPGSFADIEMPLDFNNKAIMVPSEAIIPDMKGHKVYLYNSGEAKISQVKLGIRKEKYVQIIEGLNIGDTLITSSILQLKPKAPVKIKKQI